MHDSACLTNILAPQLLQAAGISNGEWFYLRRTLSLHSPTDRPVPFNQFGNTESHAPAAQFRLSRLTTERFSRPRWSRKSRSSESQDFLATCPALVAQWQCAPRSNWVSESTRDTIRCQVAASEVEWTLGVVSTGLWIASLPCLMPWVRSRWYPPSISVKRMPRRAGRKLV